MLPKWILACGFAVVLPALSSAQCLQWDPGIPPPGQGVNGDLRDAIVWDDGTGPALYVTGPFTSIGGVAANRIAKWDGSTWVPLAQGLEGSSATGARLLAWNVGGTPLLVVAGYFDHAGGTPVGNIAVWDGTQWSTLGPGFNGALNDLEVFDAGFGPQLHACGIFGSSGSTSLNRIARWDGAQWQPLGLGISGGYAHPYAMAVYDEGAGPRLFVGGNFTQAGGLALGCFARWDGSTWSKPGAGLTTTGGVAEGVIDLTVVDVGTGPRLYAGGAFATPRGSGNFFVHCLADWDGASYEFFNGSGPQHISGFGQIRSMSALDDGTGPALFFGGTIILSGGLDAHGVAKWNGHACTTLGSGIDSKTVIEGVRALPDLHGGAPDLWVLGTFTSAGGMPTTNIARWSGCDGPGVMFCPGDPAAAVACPCANAGAYDHGCQNSASTGGALLWSSGATSPDTVVLHVQQELSMALTIFLQGDVSGTPTVFGDGLRCAAGSLHRMYVKHAAGGLASAPEPGDLGIVARAAQLGDVIIPGSQRVYQTYYRDPDLAFCPVTSGGNTWNASSALRVDW